jgi:hypothetical protein
MSATALIRERNRLLGDRMAVLVKLAATGELSSFTVEASMLLDEQVFLAELGAELAGLLLLPDPAA